MEGEEGLEGPPPLFLKREGPGGKRPKGFSKERGGSLNNSLKGKVSLRNPLSLIGEEGRAILIFGRIGIGPL